jgi:hypothetical protein
MQNVNSSIFFVAGNHLASTDQAINLQNRSQNFIFPDGILGLEIHIAYRLDEDLPLPQQNT